MKSVEIIGDLLRAAWLRVRALLNPDVVERELEEEVRFHIEMEARRLEAMGMPEDEARRVARIHFGGEERYTEQTREARATRIVEDGMQDIKYGLRMLAKNPVFTAVAVTTLALGIGANTAIYTVIQKVLLDPLPFRNPGELVALYSENRTEGQVRGMTSPMDFDDWRNQNHTFQSMAAYWPTAGTVTENDGNPTRVQLLYTTEDFFDVLGASPLMGRTFTPEDGPGSSAVAIMSYGFWQRRFGGDPSVVGNTVTLDGAPMEIVGILRGEQTFPLDADLWVNMTWPMQIQSRFARWMSAIGRLQSADGMEAARADLTTLGSRIAEENPRTNEGWSIRAEFLHDELVGDTGSALWVLLAATGLVLLIACANVANLLLSRSEVRAREIAVRAAFGAGRWRLARQLLTESLLLSGAGALVGLGLGWVGLRGLLAVAPVTLPWEESITLDGTVLMVVMGVSVVTGVLFGLAPIARLVGSDVHTAVRDGGRTTGSASRHRVQNVFVVGQLALALMVVTGAGLLVRSFDNLRAVDTGLSSSGILTMELDLPTSVAPNDTAVIEFYAQFRDRLAGLSGVELVGDAASLPLATDYDYRQPFQMDAELPPDRENRAYLRPVGPGFFEALRTPVVEGRVFDERDALGSAGVAVVNEAFARRFFPDGSPVGSSFRDMNYRFGPLGALNILDAEIVGVVKDLRYAGIREEAQPAAYFSGLQSSLRRRTILLRTSVPPATLLPSVRRELEALSGRVALTHVQTMDDVVAAARSRDRFSTLLFTLFGLVALTLAAVGVYGVLAYAVAQRTNEVGIRMALGADRGAVRAMILTDGARLVGVGLALGLVGTITLSGLMATQLYDVNPRDPGVLAAVSTMLLAVGLLASFIPAWRATLVDPVTAMRGE
jgi:putative ABC transport system permease protein